MIKEKRGECYEPSYIRGWICKFIPYDRYNHTLFGTISEIDDLHTQILDAPFNLHLIETNEDIPCKFHSGFIGVIQDPVTLGQTSNRMVYHWR